MINLSEHSWLDSADLATFAKREDAQVESIFAANQISPSVLNRGRSTRRLIDGAQARRALESIGLRYPRRSQRISMMMCKGGVGKTTVGLFLGQRLASYGARVLFIDTDPQGNLTAALRPNAYGFSLSDRTAVLLDVLAGRCQLREAILQLNPQFHLLPSTAMNSLLEKNLVLRGTSPVRELSQILRSVESQYDYIILDCAPSLNIINASIVYASDMVLLPFQLDEFSRLGLAQTVSEIADLENEFGFKTSIRLLLNKFQPNEKLTYLYLGEVAKKYRELLLQTTIRKSDEIKSALTLRRDFFLRNNSKPREDFDRLTQQILTQTMTGVQNAEY